MVWLRFVGTLRKLSLFHVAPTVLLGKRCCAHEQRLGGAALRDEPIGEEIDGGSSPSCTGQGDRGAKVVPGQSLLGQLHITASFKSFRSVLANRGGGGVT